MVDLSPRKLSLPASPCRVAVLVDGENLSSTHAASVMAVARTLGDPTIRRAYGKTEHIEGWGNEGFRLMATRSGKNAADLLLCVEAMSLALREEFQILVIASSDRDFTCLAEHLRELGHTVIGVGENKAPMAFRAACRDFMELPLQSDGQNSPISPSQAIVPMTKIIPLVRSVLQRSSWKGGGGTLPFLERHLLADGFNPAHYGQPDLLAILRKVKYFSLDESDPRFVVVRDPHSPADAATPAPHTAP